jgi:hypothetical protein
VRVELLYFDGCPTWESLLVRVRALLAQGDLPASVELHRIESERQAAEERFLGSPTLRIDGRDVEPGADERREFGLTCRLYRLGEGSSPLPLDEWIVASVEQATRTG